MSIDWSKPDTLRFRDFDAKIIEAVAPKDEKCRLSDYPVTVFYENKHGKVHATNVSLDGKYVKEGESSRDIIQIKKVPLSFWEIALMVIENGGLNVFSKHTDESWRLWGINAETEQFYLSCFNTEFLYSADKVCECFEYTLDGVERLRFEKDEE